MNSPFTSVHYLPGVTQSLTRRFEFRPRGKTNPLLVVSFPSIVLSAPGESLSLLVPRYTSGPDRFAHHILIAIWRF